MITSAENRSWPGDVPFEESYEGAGLPAPSVVRTAKIATIEAATADSIGQAESTILRRVVSEIRNSLAL